MYPEYFGLKESSFSITPDPHYLYLSPRHREALAHLLYGTGDNGGFVLLTGEVGTGKTTICRAFLEQLPDHVDVALILNPAVTAPELLQAICEEFGVEVPAGEASTKVLIDRLNRYLLEAHARGRRPVVMIDEAQNLQPEVLEQIRLLTNLETPKHKLLQVFLIGQPELRDLLGQNRLRQLAQRITARYHLRPLDAEETADYIRHRLSVAGADRPLFNRTAARRIYRYSGGVPRLINIICDRALLGAYATRRPQVDGRIVAKAARELGVARPARSWPSHLGATVLTLAMLGAAAGLVWIGTRGLDNDSNGPVGIDHPVPGEIVASESPMVPPAAVPAPAPDLPTAAPQTADSLSLPIAAPAAVSAPAPAAAPVLPAPPAPADIPEAALTDRKTAMAMLLRLWGLDPPADPVGNPCTYAEANGLRCRPTSGTWNNLRHYGLPALLELRQHGGRRGYALITGLSDTQAELQVDGEMLRVPLPALDRHWYGEFLLLWRPAPGGQVLVGAGSPPETVKWLRRALAQVPGLDVPTSDSGGFDQELRGVLIRFQTRQGLVGDGLAGPETLIRLAVAASLADVPILGTDL